MRKQFVDFVSFVKIRRLFFAIFFIALFFVLFLLSGIIKAVFLFVIFVFLFSFIYPVVFLYRVVFWNYTDPSVALKFKSKTINSSNNVYKFRKEDRAPLKIRFSEKNVYLNDFLQETKTSHFLVVRNSEILFDKTIFTRAKQKNYCPFLYSITKSILSLMVGNALLNGKIKSLNDSITNYLPELKSIDARLSFVKIKNLLLMNSGIRYSLFFDHLKLNFYPDIKKLALNKIKIKFDPGKYFVYNSYDVFLLAIALERATGLSISDYYKYVIVDKLGFEFPSLFLLDSKNKSFELVQSGLVMDPIDLAKIGQLILNQGIWGRERVVPVDWLSNPWKDRPCCDNKDYYSKDYFFRPFLNSKYVAYKNFWWFIKRKGQSADIFAQGMNNQFMYINYRKKIIIVRNGIQNNKVPWLKFFIDLIDQL